MYSMVDEKEFIQRMDLSRLKPGEKAKVVCIQGGRGVTSRLETLGLRPGCSVKVVTSQPGGGPIVVQVNNTQAAIGCGMAMKVMVQLVTPYEADCP